MSTRLFRSFTRLPWTPKLPPGDEPALLISAKVGDDPDLGLTCLINGAYRLPRAGLDPLTNPLSRLLIVAVEQASVHSTTGRYTEEQLHKAPDTRQGKLFAGAFAFNLFDQLAIVPGERRFTVSCSIGTLVSNVVSVERPAG